MPTLQTTMEEKKAALRVFFEHTQPKTIVWFMVTDGLIVGSDGLLAENGATIMLIFPEIYSGQYKISVEMAQIPIDKILAWGTGEPLFEECDPG